MPNEPKHDAEAMLKAYAERRRAEAGPPIEPHPVTRKLLHEEVARTFPAHDRDAPSWRQLFLGMIPRLAVAAGLSAALALTVYLVHREKPGALTMAMNESAPASPRATVPKTSGEPSGMIHNEKLQSLAADDPARMEAEKKAAEVASEQAIGGAVKDRRMLDELARKKLELADTDGDRAKLESRRAGGAGNLETDTKKMAPNAPTGVAEAQTLAKATEAGAKPADSEGKKSIAAAKSEATEPLPTAVASAAPRPASSPAPASPAAPTPAAQFALQNPPGDKAAAPKTAATLALDAKTPANGLGVAPATAAATQEVSQNFYFKEATRELRQNFSQVNQRSQYRVNVNSPKPSPVLNNFQLERSGSRIQVTDADGSIYLGAVVPAETGAATSLAEAEANKTSQAGRAAKPAMSIKPPAGASATLSRKDSAAVAEAAARELAQDNFAFQVEGTNRTVNKVVVFNGTLNIDPALNAVAQQTPQLRGAQEAFKQSQSANNAAQNSQNRFITNQAGLIQNGRLSGQAIVGGREKLPIDAVPISP